MKKQSISFSIERATERDIQELSKLYLEGYRGLEEYSYTNVDDVMAYINWLFRRDIAGILVAKYKGKIIGFIASDGNWFSKREGKTVGAIHELVVLPDYRSKGVGNALIRKVLEYFKSRGLDTAELWVGDENYDAINFYTSLGFEIKDRMSYWIRMVKKLDN